MKLKGLLILMVCCMSLTTKADVAVSMQQLPQEIVINENETGFTFKKGARSDSFYFKENKKGEKTYRQTYRNDICFASVTYAPTHIGRLSNIKVKRHIKEITHFQVTRQDGFKVGDASFFMNAETTPEQTTVLLLTGQKDAFLKVDVACQTLPSLDEKQNENAAIYFAKKIAESALFVLK